MRMAKKIRRDFAMAGLAEFMDRLLSLALDDTQRHGHQNQSSSA
jgi:hypothetical protein